VAFYVLHEWFMISKHTNIYLFLMPT